MSAAAEREWFEAHKAKASEQAAHETRHVACTCGWPSDDDTRHPDGAHASDCEREKAYETAYYAELDQLVNADEEPAAVTVLDVLRARMIAAAPFTGKDTAPRETFTGDDFDRYGLPMVGGCEICGATIAAYNAAPSRSGFLRCSDSCIEDLGFESVADFERFEAGTREALEGDDDRSGPTPARLTAERDALSDRLAFAEGLLTRALSVIDFGECSIRADIAAFLARTVDLRELAPCLLCGEPKPSDTSPCECTDPEPEP